MQPNLVTQTLSDLKAKKIIKPIVKKQEEVEVEPKKRTRKKTPKKDK